MKSAHLLSLPALALAVALSGCATTPHSCPLDHGLGCHSQMQAYQAALHGGGNQQSVFGAPSVRPGVPVAAPSGAILGTPGGYPQAGAGGTPVWTPGQVYRAWTAPWTDAEGYLHSGGYVYFNTPGHWSYGSLTASGPAAGVLHPIKPSALGFTPGGSVAQGKQENPSVAGGTRAAMGAIDNSGGVTQPAEQITQ
ncbi:TraV family lipoprotein [Thiomonas sp.]